MLGAGWVRKKCTPYGTPGCTVLYKIESRVDARPIVGVYGLLLYYGTVANIVCYIVTIDTLTVNAYNVRPLPCAYAACC